MKRLVLAGLVALLGLAAAGYGVHWLTRPCRVLDRLFGISGCSAVMRITDFSPIREHAISPPDSRGVASLFGHTATVEGWRPSMARVDLAEGRELARYPVRSLNGFGRIVFAADGERALLTCNLSYMCTEDGKAAAVLSLKDGAILETRDGIGRYLAHFPGDPAPEGEEGRRVFAANGSRIVEVRRGNTLALLTAGGETVKTLLEGDRRNDILLTGISVSPSGKRIALFEHANYGKPARLHVWDALTGDLLGERDLGMTYRRRFTPVWTDEETRLTLFRPDGSDTLIEFYRWQ